MEQPLSLVLTLLFAHFIGDFVLQTTNQAIYKYTDTSLLWEHVWSWVLALAVSLVIYHFATGYSFNANHATFWLFTMAGTHFLTDFFTSRFNKMFKDSNSEKYFWCMIGFDQFIHAATILFFASIWL